MKVIIPAAGQGTRLRPHTFTVPKVLLPVAGRPIVGHILADISRLDPDEVRLVVGYHGETLLDYAESDFPGLPVRAVWQERQLGLGHAVLEALDENDEGSVLIVLGDTVFDVDYSAVVGSGSALGVRQVPDPERFGIVELDESGGRIVRLIEKPADPPGNLALVGLYFVRDCQALRRALSGLLDEGAQTRGEYQLTDALQAMIDEGEAFAPFEIDGWFDCGKPETLIETNRALLERGAGVGAPEPAVLEDSVIVPPVAIGAGCSVRNAVVGPFVSLSAGVTISDAIVRDSIIGENAIVDGAVLEGSIIGPGAKVQGQPRRLSIGDYSETL